MSDRAIERASRRAIGAAADKADMMHRQRIWRRDGDEGKRCGWLGVGADRLHAGAPSSRSIEHGG